MSKQNEDTNAKNLLLLFDRPQEPIFIPKGENNTIFDIPQNYLTDRYQPISVQLFDRFGEESGEQIIVKAKTLPPLGEILTLKRRENFSLFLPKHQRLAGRLIDILMGMKNCDDLQSMAVYARDRVNPLLFNYCLSVALLHRPDTKHLDIPLFIQSFPNKFFDSQVFARAREEASIVPEQSRIPIEIPKDYTASDLEDEHRLAYFREDLGINLHHWHWHLVYPAFGPSQVVNKDRRGELFYYMHEQVLARYNCERICNKLKRVNRLIDLKAPIEEGYFPKLDSSVASRAWPGRVPNQTIKNLNREGDQLRQDVDDLIRWRDRIYDAIHSGVASGKFVELTERDGIDILGNLTEASLLSLNQSYYGNLHNVGHAFIGYINDPDQRFLESFGVMGDTATAMRDPIFYRWHAFLNEMFLEYKSSLPFYPIDKLNFPGVSVTKMEVTSKGNQPNRFNTFWQQSDVDLSRGMDFQPRGPVFVRFTHLQHQPFAYNITVNNDGIARMGTCRIFVAPKFDERGIMWRFRDQQHLFIELDKFSVNLKEGLNTIVRKSTESNVTIPFDRTFRNLSSRPTGGNELAEFNFCGCGWPAHMLLPKGTAEGFPVQLFVMISNFEDDKINQTTEGSCSDAASYCGIRDKLYPDRRSMGYPFDRVPRPGVSTLQEFLTFNMLIQDCIIKFNDRILRQPNISN